MTARTGIIMNSYAGGGAERSSLTTASAWPATNEAVLITCLAEGPYQSSVPHDLPTAEIGVWPVPSKLATFARKLRHTILGGQKSHASM